MGCKLGTTALLTSSAQPGPGWPPMPVSKPECRRSGSKWLSRWPARSTAFPLCGRVSANATALAAGPPA